ncbi:uncharacterized protein LOC131005844 [Salvia miltiorrhiza]|uniref:uncharacterized protein LOC131005844 n=1 Tax=Salvia miltiorrhiza TaxID=226208 RepID=UPI0025AB6B9D|nr:uncharacterized protein LOC131005844 [Salvia miltiorrhiza]
MANSEKQQSTEDRRIDDVDRADQVSGGDGSMEVSSSGDEASVRANRSVTRRLTEILVEDRDADLLLQRSGREEGVIQWLRALDLQVTGACRADERLKPLLKLNASAAMAEDGLLAHLSQHFEPSEVGMLARCLCAPLVSIRVGKINKQGTFLSPTSVRGNLCLTLLPTSDLRISFNGDDGSEERLATLSTEAQCTDVEINEIPADKSGRSFFVKNSDGVVSYFWCSEKSMLVGYELLRKLKDLLAQKPSLAELTGISESRLNSFVSHLRAYLAGTVVNSAQVSGALPASPSDSSADSSEHNNPHSSANCLKSSRARQYGSQGSKTNLIYQGCLSPRSSSFKEGMQKSLSDIRIAAREKLRRRGENNVQGIDSLLQASSKTCEASSSHCFQKDKLPEVNGNGTPLQFASLSLSFLEVFGTSGELPPSGPDTQAPSSSPSPFSPHYCWCPPVASALQFTKGNSLVPTESLSLPPLSSLLSSARSSGLVTSKPLLDLAELPPFDFPSFLPEPLVRLPSSQQIPTFTPLICDPIVHIPVIDICSSGQGYLVSAGPAMSTSIPPLNPNLVDPLLPNGESMVEKSARETLRMLINSSNQPNPRLLEVLPSVLSSSIDSRSILAAGSRGLYIGTKDVEASSMPSFELVLLSENSAGPGAGGSIVKRIASNDHKEKASTSDPSSFEEAIE